MEAILSNSRSILLIAIVVIMGIGLYIITQLDSLYGLNRIKSKTVGDGQHGTARWATKKEIATMWNIVPFEPEKWRKNKGKVNTWTNPQTNKEEPIPQENNGWAHNCRRSVC